MKLLSRQATYGIRAALYIASRGADKSYVPVREIAEHLGISFHFLAKIFRVLARNNLMISYRGPNGGVGLARPARKITLLDLVIALEGEDFFTGCILGLPGCGMENPCPLHDAWSEVRESTKRLFESATLAGLGGRIERENLRIGYTPSRE